MYNPLALESDALHMPFPWRIYTYIQPECMGSTILVFRLAVSWLIISRLCILIGVDTRPHTPFLVCLRYLHINQFAQESFLDKTLELAKPPMLYWCIYAWKNLYVGRNPHDTWPPSVHFRWPHHLPVTWEEKRSIYTSSKSTVKEHNHWVPCFWQKIIFPFFFSP